MGGWFRPQSFFRDTITCVTFYYDAPAQGTASKAGKGRDGEHSNIASSLVAILRSIATSQIMDIMCHNGSIIQQAVGDKRRAAIYVPHLKRSPG